MPIITYVIVLEIGFNHTINPAVEEESSASHTG